MAKTTCECNQENHVLTFNYNDNVVKHNVHVVPNLQILLNKKKLKLKRQGYILSNFRLQYSNIVSHSIQIGPFGGIKL